MATKSKKAIKSSKMDNHKNDKSQRKGGQSSSTRRTTNDLNQKGGQSSGDHRADTGFTMLDDDIDQGIAT